MMMEILTNYWGLIAAAILVAIYAVNDFEKFKKKAAALIFVAEERAEEYVLETGTEKFEWVVENAYPYLPKWLKLALSESAFRAVIQYVFNQIVKWAEQERTRA